MIRPTRTATRIVVGTLAIGAVAAPFAVASGEGNPLRGGVRNPGASGSSALTKETQVIAKTAKNTFGTRQSNKGAGGGAIYGCRATFGASPSDPKVTTPCVRINNLANGEAFQFQSRSGALVGLIQVGDNFAANNDNAKPFITNATGIATGLNADRLDGLHAADIIAQAKQATPASSAPSFAYARVNPDGTLDASRTQGVAQTNVVRASPGVYCYTGLTSKPKNAQATIDGATPGDATVDTTTNNPGAVCNGATNVELIVRTFNTGGTLTDLGYQLQITA